MSNFGIILAGGMGTRLYPITQVVSKQLLPVYNKPMVYYPLSTLLARGCEDILVITNPEHVPQFESLLISSEVRFGARIWVTPQEHPRGLADALIIADDFLSKKHPGLKREVDRYTLALGDNLFYGPNFHHLNDWFLEKDSAQLHTYPVVSPQNYGVLQEILPDPKNPSIIVQQIVEKPAHPVSNQAVIGLYEYPKDAPDLARTLKPSPRGEIEITDLNNLYLEDNRGTIAAHDQPSVWMDMGTPTNLLETASFIQAVENRTGTLVGSPELAKGVRQARERDLGTFMSLEAWSLLYPPNSEYTKRLIHLLNNNPF